MRYLLIISVPLLAGLFACTGGLPCLAGTECSTPTPVSSSVVVAMASAMPSTGGPGSCTSGGMIVASTVGSSSCSSSSPGTQPGSGATPAMPGMSAMPASTTASTPPAQTVAPGGPTFQNCYNGGIPNAAFCGQISTNTPYYQNCYGNCPGNVNPTSLVTYVKPPATGFHEFQVNCPVFQHIGDDPIVDPGKPGVSHIHAFFGNKSANANSTLTTLMANPASTCSTVGDFSSYWMPTLYTTAGLPGTPLLPVMPAMPGMAAIPANAAIVDPNNQLGAIGSTIVYYKAGTSNYTAVQPFPQGFKMVVGTHDFDSANSFHGFYSCTPGVTSLNFPPSCPPGNKLIVRLEAPSCWDGVNLDSPTHNTHIVYPTHDTCPTDHPKFLPMLQFKIPYVVDGINMSTLRFVSGGAYTFHYDYIAAWDTTAEAAIIAHCINGGRQCNAQGN